MKAKTIGQVCANSRVVSYGLRVGSGVRVWVARSGSGVMVQVRFRVRVGVRVRVRFRVRVSVMVTRIDRVW